MPSPGASKAIAIVDGQVRQGRVDAVAEKRIWQRLQDALSEWRADWRTIISSPEAPVQKRLPDFRGCSDERIFEAFTISALSGNARWDRLAAIRGQLPAVFKDFDPARYSTLSEREILDELVPWFRSHRAGSAGLGKTLVRLREAARILSISASSVYLENVAGDASGSPEQMAMLLGSSKNHKLPGFGIALAAEALRLLGADLCKPDRHVLRALAAWDIVRFRRSPEGPFASPEARPAELLEAMLAVRRLAAVNEKSVSYANSVIWLAGAVSGARLTNPELALIASNRNTVRANAGPSEPRIANRGTT